MFSDHLGYKGVGGIFLKMVVELHLLCTSVKLVFIVQIETFHLIIDTKPDVGTSIEHQVVLSILLYMPPALTNFVSLISYFTTFVNIVCHPISVNIIPIYFNH